MSAFWKSPRPEIGESELFSYENKPVEVVGSVEVPQATTLRTIVKGLPTVAPSTKTTKVSTEYNEVQISAIVKAWLTR